MEHPVRVYMYIYSSLYPPLRVLFLLYYFFFWTRIYLLYVRIIYSRAALSLACSGRRTRSRKLNPTCSNGYNTMIYTLTTASEEREFWDFGFFFCVFFFTFLLRFKITTSTPRLATWSRPRRRRRRHVFKRVAWASLEIGSSSFFIFYFFTSKKHFISFFSR